MYLLSNNTIYLLNTSNFKAGAKITMQNNKRTCFLINTDDKTFDESSPYRIYSRSSSSQLNITSVKEVKPYSWCNFKNDATGEIIQWTLKLIAILALNHSTVSLNNCVFLSYNVNNTLSILSIIWCGIDTRKPLYKSRFHYNILRLQPC